MCDEARFLYNPVRGASVGVWVCASVGGQLLYTRQPVPLCMLLTAPRAAVVHLFPPTR